MAKKELDPYTRAFLARLHKMREAGNLELAADLRRAGLPVAKVGEDFKPRWVDPNPWDGKARIPELLLRALLAGKGMDCKSNKARHDLLISDVVMQSGGAKDSPYSSTVWSRKLEKFALKNCLALLTDAGYKPSKADVSLSNFVKLIRAGVPDKAERVDSCKVFGEGIHAIKFFSANHMLYRGEESNVQWSHKNKVCPPTQGLGRVRVKGKRVGLFVYLAESITREDWAAIKQCAQDAGDMVAVKAVKAKLKSDKATKCDAEIAVLDMLLRIDAETPEA